MREKLIIKKSIIIRKDVTDTYYILIKIAKLKFDILYIEYTKHIL